MKRNMKLFVRMLCLLIACLTVLALVVACDGDGDKNTVKYKDNTKDRNGRLKDSLPDMDDDPSNDLNYEGEIINLMYWAEVERPEFEQEEITGDNVRDAIYDRNVNVEDRLNVDLNFIPVYAAYHGAREPFLKHIDAIYNAGTQDYDIIATYARTEGTLSVQGFLQNLSTIKDSYIDLEKPWWPAQLLDTVTFGNNSYYFLSGDMSTNVLQMMHLMFINKTMFEELEIELPYEAVRKGEWTVDKLIEVTSDRYVDVDGNNMVSTGDTFGFCALHYVCDSFYPGSNLRYIVEDETDMLKLSPDYGSAKTVKLINKLGQWAATDSIWITHSYSNTEEEQNATRKLFAKEQALVWMEHACFAESSLLDVDFDYGLVPNPKYDTKQKNYYTGMGNPFSLYGVYIDFDERGNREETLKMFTAVLECYASEAYRLTTPEIFEVNMQLKYSEGQDETDMFEYVRSGIVFDLGKIFSVELDNMPELASHAIAGNSSWSHSYKSYKRSIEKKLANIVKDFRDYQAHRDN